MNRTFRLVTLQSVGWWMLFSAAGLPGSAAACDTPVYRYAMYRWTPAPYEVYYFYDGQPDATGQKIQAAVDATAGHTKPAANVVFFPVDLQKDKELTGVPPDVKDAWTKRSPQQTPWYLVSSPRGAHIRDGSMTEADVATLIDSPARQQIGRLLEEGRAGVYLLVSGAEARATEAAEQVIQGMLDDVAAGKIELYAASTAPAEDSAADDVPQPTTELGLIRLARDDAAEKALIDSLLALEPDLRQSTEPLVFLVYGRGRALFSCLGKGVHRDNLIQDVEFISGACSCTVKEQNPGVDLLIRYDWDAVAEALSEKFGSEEGSPYRFGGDTLFPELVIPPHDEPAAPSRETLADGAGSDVVSSDVVSSDVVSSDVVSSDVVSSDTVMDTGAMATDLPSAPGAATNEAGRAMATSLPSNDAVSLKSLDTAVPEDATSSSHVAANTSPSLPSNLSAASQPSSAAWQAVLWVGAGLLGALVLLFGATFLVLRPR
ncbi:MAG: hypothetical protein ACYC6N_22350 [Pirellulaceae bacterium]